MFKTLVVHLKKKKGTFAKYFIIKIYYKYKYRKNNNMKYFESRY